MRRSAYVAVVFVVLGACKTASQPKPYPAGPSEMQPPPAGAETAKAVPPRDMPAPPAAEWVGSPLWRFKSQRAATWTAGDRSSLLPSVVVPKKGAKGDVRDIYKKVAPATVIVHAGDSMGSGVLVRDSGWLLTNYHVVRDGQRQDLLLKVGVELGTLDPATGVMTRTNKILPATVQKVDPVRDLALVKIDDPPGVLPFVKLGTSVSPGEPVTSLGHASIGLLWAIKDGEVSAIGNVADDRAMAELVLAPCTQEMASTEPAECAQRKEQVAEIREALKRSHDGLVIQTTCDIWHGDSGGPLVNRAAELVGLNDFGYSDPKGGAHSNFHIHLNDIKSFLAQVPAQPRRMVPDPFAVEGMAKYDDVDDDGEVDTLGVEGDDAVSFLFDLAQGSLQKYDRPRPSDAIAKHSFDARVAFMRDGGASYVLYDTSGKGHFDVLVVDQKSNGKPTAAYRVDGEQVTKDDSLLSGGDFKLALIKDAGERDRFAKIVKAVFAPSFLAASMAGDAGERHPAPTWKDATNATVDDSDGDGTPDTYRITRDWDSGFVLDAAQKTPHQSDALAALHAGTLVGDMSFVTRPDERYAFYDSDGDGAYDLALHAQPGMGLVDGAFAVAGDQLGAARDEFVGQLIAQPALVGADVAAHKRAAAALGMSTRAQDPAVGAFPDVLAIAKGSEAADYAAVPKWEHAVLKTSSAVLIDPSRARERRRKGDAVEELASGKFAAQFAYLEIEGAQFFFYDTTGAGRFDVVLVATDPRSGVAAVGYRLTEGKRPVRDDKLSGEKLVRSSLFRDRATAAAFSEIAKSLFNPRAIGG